MLVNGWKQMPSPRLKEVSLMDKLEKVELVRAKAGVSYQDAKEALEACEYDVLDAIIWLENAGKADVQTASYETTSNSSYTQTASPEMREAQEEYQRTSKKTKVGEVFSGFCEESRKIIRAGIDMTFIAERNGHAVVSVPLIIVVAGILFWGASIWLLIVGLFFGFRYRIEGASPLTIDVNDAMDKAADAAESIKNDFGKDE